LHFVALFSPKSFLTCTHLAQGGGAKIGALGKAKKHHHHLPFEVCQSSHLTQLIGQAKAFGVISTGQINGLKVLLSGAQAKNKAQKQEQFA
jgi:hypothetical protein